MICTDSKKVHFSGSYLARMSISMNMYKQKDACEIWDSLSGVTEDLNLLKWDTHLASGLIVYKYHNAFIFTVKHLDSLTLQMKAQSFETSGTTHLMTVSHPETLDCSERWHVNSGKKMAPKHTAIEFITQLQSGQSWLYHSHYLPLRYLQRNIIRLRE